jgi:hypothetical protein
MRRADHEQGVVENVLYMDVLHHTLLPGAGSRRPRCGLVIYAWMLAEGWDERHELDVAVALVGRRRGRHDAGRAPLDLALPPRGVLREDLLAAGLEPVTSTYAPDVAAYLVTARRVA